MKSKEEIKAAAENFINTTGELYPVSLFVAGARWMEKYASQQAPAMYTREQVEAAFTAGMNYEYGNHFGAVPNSYMNKQQFIQSIK